MYMMGIASDLQKKLLGRIINKFPTTYDDKAKSDFVLLVLTFLTSLIVLILINLFCIKVYQIDVEQVLNEVSGLFLEKDRFALWPEPVERAQYLLTIISAPLVAYANYYLWSKTINRISGSQRNVIFHLSCFVSVFLLSVLIYFDLKPNPDNFITLESSPYYRDIRIFVSMIWRGETVHYSLFCLPFVFFFMHLGSKNLFYVICKNVFYVLIAVCLIEVFLFNLFNRDNYPGHNHHLMAVYSSVAQVVNGKTLLVDFTNQYGLYPHFLQPIFKHVELNLLNFSIVMSLLVVLSYGCLLFFMKSIINNIVLLFLGFIGLVFLHEYFLTAYGYGDPYFQYTPIRFFSLVFFCFCPRFILRIPMGLSTT